MTSNTTRLPIRHEPLRAMFFTTSMPVGGAETLLVNLLQQLNPDRVGAELCCLKERGPLGDVLAHELPVHAELLHYKTDVAVLRRLKQLLQRRHIDAVVTVGAGDKMFWGRLAAKWAGVPVICSALHSTGWPDGVGRLNRWLTPITDAFIGVAQPHARHLVDHEGFPPHKVFVIPNGVDTERFQPAADSASAHLRQQLGLSPTAPVVGIVAALRPEKNHALFLQVAAQVSHQLPEARFLIVGDGPERGALEEQTHQLGLDQVVQFLGTRNDIPELLNLFDVNLLTSHNEANPVSILEALSTGTPTVATDVGSVGETVIDGQTGYLAPPGDGHALAHHVLSLLQEPLKRQELGDQGRQLVVQRWSLQQMVSGYEQLLWKLYEQKTGRSPAPVSPPLQPTAVG